MNPEEANPEEANHKGDWPARTLADFPVAPHEEAAAIAEMEQAMLAGKITAATLKKVYLKINDPDQYIDAIIDDDFLPDGAQGRAIYFTFMENYLDFIPAGFARDRARLEMLQKMIQDADGKPEIAVLARLFAEELGALSVSGNMVELAIDFLPLLWLSGEVQKSASWVERLGLEARFNDGLRKALLRLWPALVITNQISKLEPKMANPDLYYNYLIQQQGLEVFRDQPRPIPKKLVAVSSVLAALNKLPSHPAYKQAIDMADKEFAQHAQQTPILAIYDKAVTAKQAGSVLALGLILLGDAEDREIKPGLLRRIIGGFYQHDAEKAAMAVAIDRVLRSYP